MRTITRFAAAILAAIGLSASAWADYTSTVFNRPYTYVFRGTTDANWATVGNWYRYTTSDNNWEQLSENKAPGAAGSNLWEAVLLDGALMGNISAGVDGYKTITMDGTLEGWETPIGVANRVHLKISTLRKLQGNGSTDRSWRVDENSKITVTTFGVSGQNSSAGQNFYVDAPEGITFQNAFTGGGTLDVSCYFGKRGSIKFEKGTGGGTYRIASVALDCGGGEGIQKCVLSRPLIAYASKDATMTVNTASVTVTGSYQDGTAVACNSKDSTPTIEDPVGTYKFADDAPGVITYVATVPVATLDGQAAAWTTASLWDTNQVPTSGSAQVKTTADTTLTVGEAAMQALVFSGPAKTTLTGDAALTAGNTTIGGDVDVSGATHVALGTVSIAAGKTFTVNGSNPTAAFSTLVPAAGSANYALSAPNSGETSLEGLKSFIAGYTGTVTLLGTTKTTGEGEAQTTTSTGYSLLYGISETTTLNARLVFSGGAHNFQFGRGVADSIFSTVKGDTNPAISIQDGAQVSFCMKDLSGWGGNLEETPATIRVGKDSSLTFTQSGSATGFFRNRLLLEGGAKVTSGAFVILYGGATTTAAQAQIAMPESSEAKEATITGTLGLMNISGGQTTGNAGASVAVGANATLKMEASLVGDGSSNTFRKLGAGTLNLVSTGNTTTLPLAVDAGRVVVANGAKWVSTITVAGGATLEVAGTPANTLSMAVASGATAETPAKFVKSGSGDADWSALTGHYAVSLAADASGTLTLAAGSEGTMTVPENVTLCLVLSKEQLLENYTTAATINGTLNFVKRNAEGTIVELDDAEDGTVSGSTFTAAVNTWQAAEGATTGTWSDTARWSRGRAPTADESAKIVLNRDTTLTVDVAAPCSMLSVTGTGTLTLAGSECLTIANKLLVTANVGLTATATNLAPVAADVAEGATFSYESGAVTLPALTGRGIFVKTGANTLTLSAANSYEPAITVSGGTLLFDSSAVHSQAYRVTVKRGAFAQVGTWTGGLTNSEASLRLEAGGTLKLFNGNSSVGSSPFAAKVVVDSTATVDNPAIIQAGTQGDASKISGLITSSGGTAGVLRLEKLGTNKVSLTGSITNVHLINKDMEKLEISGQISGGSSLTVKGGQVTLSNKHSYTGATTVETKGKLILAGGADALSMNTSDTALVTVNGTLQAQNNGNDPTTYYRQTEGTGVIYVPAGQTLAIGLTDHDGESGLTNFTGTLRVAGTFDARNWKAETTYTISGFNIVFEGNNGEIKKHNGALPAAVTIAAGKTLSGTGTINVPVTFENNDTATMDSEANITFGSTLTVPKNVTLPGRVNLASTAVLSGAGKLLGAGELSGVVSFAEGATIDATTSTVEQMLKFTGTPTFAATIPVKVAGLCSLFSVPKTVNLTAGQVRLTWAESAIAGSKVMLLTVSNTTTVRLFVPPTVSVSEDPESPRDAGVDEAITKAAETSAEWGVVISKVTAISATGTDGKSTRDVNAAALFDGVLSLTPVGNHKEDGTSDATATVTYDFGVSDITVKSANLTGSAQLYVVVCAKVSNATGNETNTADYANDTTVSLWLNNAAADGAVALDPNTLSTKFGLTAGTGEKWFAVPMAKLNSGTNAFTVRATNTAQAEATP